MKNMDMIAGYEREKRELLQLRSLLHLGREYREWGIRIPRGAILYGSSGVGKTVMARSIADEGIGCICLRAADFCGTDVAAKVHEAFVRAREQAPVVLLFDELDKVTGRQATYGENGDVLGSELLRELDELSPSDDVLVVATCEDPGDLDESLVRLGRFERVIEIPEPDAADREEIFAHYFAALKIPREVECDYLARLTPGYVGAEIASIVNEAAIMAMEKAEPSITLEDIRRVMNRLALHGPEEEREGEVSRVTAIHEAGHALVALLLAPDCLYGASVLSQGHSGGHIQFICSEGGNRRLLQEVAEISVLLAGRVAEQECFGEVYLGDSSDLRRAWNKAHYLITRHAICGYRYLRGNADEGVNCSDRIDDVLSCAEREARMAICNHSKTLNRIADALQEKYVLSREELLDLAGDLTAEPAKKKHKKHKKKSA